MSVYSLDHIIQECIGDRLTVHSTARGKSNDAKVEIYSSSWLTLNAWIESRLSRHKGASISGFGSFCWEMLEKDGETHCRPLFIPSDAFVKLYKVRRQRIHRVPQLTPVEEVNYSLLAIKYSKTLTKDMVYAGIHDILKKLGDYISRGYEMEVDFTFGTLCVKENRIKFIFSQSRLLEILPENLEPDVLSRDLSPMRYLVPNDQQQPNSSRPNSSRGQAQTPTTKTTARRPSTSSGTNGGRAIQLPKLPLRPLSRSIDSSSALLSETADLNNSTRPNAGGRPIVPPLTMNLSTTNNNIHSNPHQGNNNNLHTQGNDFFATGIAARQEESAPAHAQQEEEEDIFSQTPPPDLQEVLDAIGSRQLKIQKDAFREQAKARVEAQAYARCLSQLESSAQEDDIKRFEARKDFDAWREKLQQERLHSTQQIEKLKEELNQQIAHNESRAERERLEQKRSVSAFFLGDKAGMAPSPLGTTILANGKVVNGRMRISKDLEEQIRSNAERKTRLERETKLRERDQMDRLALETEMQQVMKRAEHLEKQRQLLQAWERDGHIRNLQKLQSHGTNTVKDYIDRNLSTPPDSAMFNQSQSGPGTLNGMTLGRAITSSIGYDPRVGK